MVHIKNRISAHCKKDRRLYPFSIGKTKNRNDKKAFSIRHATEILLFSDVLTAGQAMWQQPKKKWLGTCNSLSCVL